MLPTIALLVPATITISARSPVPAESAGKFRPRSTAVIRTVARGFQSVCLSMLAWQMRRMNRAILGALDDRSLRDIGLHRSGIEAAVANIDAALAARRKRAVIRQSCRVARVAAVLGGRRRPHAIQGG